MSPYGMGSNVCHLTVALLLHIISCTDKSKEEVLLSSYLMGPPPIAIVDIIYSMLFFCMGDSPFLLWKSPRLIWKFKQNTPAEIVLVTSTNKLD